jgi:hypothetical protein
MAECIEREINECEAAGRPITLSGIMLACGIYTRNTFDEYGKKDGFSPLVKRAKALVAHAYEEKLSYEKPTGAIFALKNMGWSDGQRIDIGNPPGETFKTDSVSDIEVARRIAFVLARATQEEPES